MRRKNNIPVKSILITVLVLIVLFGLLRYVSFFLKSTNYFIIQDVLTNQQNIDVSYLKGKNILLLDLKKESERLRRAYPAYQKVKLIRQFPDRLIVAMHHRQAVAYVRLNRSFLVDSEAVLFNHQESYTDTGLPTIIGLSEKIPNPKEAMRYNNIGDLALALDIISRMDKTGISKKYPIKSIAVSNPTQVSIFVFQGAEIKLAKSDIPRQLKNFVSLLNKARLDLAKVRYIDFRFKEPTVMFYDEK